MPMKMLETVPDDIKDRLDMTSIFETVLTNTNDQEKNMEHVLTGLKNFLELINQNWTLITVIMGLGLLAFRKIESYLSLSEQEKINLALEQVRVTALKMVTNAEIEYDEWVKAGSIKRSEVIDHIFEKYPILSKVTDQEDLIKKIDEIIDEALVTMREVIEENTKTK